MWLNFLSKEKGQSSFTLTFSCSRELPHLIIQKKECYRKFCTDQMFFQIKEASLLRGNFLLGKVRGWYNQLPVSGFLS